MTQKYVYVMTAPSSWDKPGIRYRRHQFAKLLKGQQDTDDVVWAYPVSASFRIPRSFIKARHELEKNSCKHVNEDGVKECAIPDYLPGRYMQYRFGAGKRWLDNLKKLLKKSNAKLVLWYTYPNFPYLTTLVDWDIIVYDCSDLWIEPSGGSRSNAFSSRVAKSLIESAEKKIIENSNIVFASSDYLAERIERVSGRQAVTIENGVDYSYFQKAHSKTENVLENIPGLKLGYVGALRSKIDLSLMEELACFDHNWSIVLIGPNCLNESSYFERLVQKDNVFWTGEVDPSIIPDYIKALDVGLLPYRDLEYNKAVFPIKFYEYLSQGIPVVGCGLPSTEKYSENGIYLHVDRDYFPQACKKVLSWPTGEQDVYVSRRIKLAQEATWENKLNYILDKISDSISFG